MSDFLQNIYSPVHSSWKELFTPEITQELKKIEDSISRDSLAYTPEASRVFHFITNDLNSAKVVIIGQDPYPQDGVATGRAFEVATLKDWNEPFRNVSLKNIVRAVYNAYTGEFLKFNDIKKKLNGGLFGQEFELLPPNELFKSWEKQGVLLLNTSFTTVIGKPGSHSKIWNGFTRELLSYINDRNRDVIWFLWGNHAKAVTSHLDLKNVFTSNHPMICKPGDDDFLFGKVNMFAETRNIINWKGV